MIGMIDVWMFSEIVMVSLMVMIMLIIDSDDVGNDDNTHDAPTPLRTCNSFRLYRRPANTSLIVIF